MTTRIYDRPDLDQQSHRPALFINGDFPIAKPGLAYDGRLQIRNPVGACTVEQIDGDQLPPGASLYVDNASHEVVVTWPPYSLTDSPILNGNFEMGDVDWIKDAGWTIENTGGGNDGFGSKVAVFLGQGEAFLEAANYYPVQAQVFSAKINVQQGASSAGNVGASIGVRYYDAAKTLIATQLGRFIDSGSKGAWHWSEGVFSQPAGAIYQRPIVRAYRRRENKKLWVDDASWSYRAILGVDDQLSYNLTIRVRDSAGRSALWNGKITVRDGDEHYAHVRYLLHFDPEFTNPDGSFINSAPVPNSSIIINRGGVLSVGGKFSDGISTAPADSSVYAIASPSNGVGSADFTVEGWINLAAAPAAPGSFISFFAANFSTWKLVIDTAGRPVIQDYNSVILTSSTPVADGAWHHVAVVRIAGVAYLYVDGLLSGSNAMPRNYNYSASPFSIGADRSAGVPVAGTQLVGLFDEIRVTTTVGRYTDNFIPPRGPFPGQGV